MQKILLTLFVLLAFAYSQSGFINAGNTTNPVAGNFNISWATCNNNGIAEIYITMSSQYPGWMGLQPKPIGGPIKGNVGHINSDVIFMWVDATGIAHIYDMYSPFTGFPSSNGANCTQYGSCTDLDTNFPGGKNDVQCVASSSSANGVSITFKRVFISDDIYDYSFNSNYTVWALGKDVVPTSYVDASNEIYMHCSDCLKALYTATCGAAITAGLRQPCGATNTSIGYQARNQNMPIIWWNGTDPTTLPNCNSDPVNFPQTVCPTTKNAAQSLVISFINVFVCILLVLFGIM